LTDPKLSSLYNTLTNSKQGTGTNGFNTLTTDELDCADDSKARERHEHDLTFMRRHAAESQGERARRSSVIRSPIYQSRGGNIIQIDEK
jgi:hypothetical protein